MTGTSLPTVLQVGFLTLGILFLSSCSPSPSPAADPTESSREEGPNTGPKTLVSVFELALGACVNDQFLPEGADMDVVEVVECEQPHEAELFAKLALTEDSYPGTDYLINEGGSRCQEAFGDFVGLDFTESVLDFTYYYPTPSSWVDGDRSIYCLAIDPGLKTTGSLLGARR